MSESGWMILQAAPGGGIFDSMLFPMVMIFVIFYFLLIRPQQKQQKEHDQMLKSIAKGDRVVTVGGVHGLVTGEAEEVLTLEIANMKGGERIRIKVDRARIERREASESEGDKGNAKGGSAS